MCLSPAGSSHNHWRWERHNEGYGWIDNRESRGSSGEMERGRRREGGGAERNGCVNREDLIPPEGGISRQKRKMWLLSTRETPNSSCRCAPRACGCSPPHGDWVSPPRGAEGELYRAWELLVPVKGQSRALLRAWEAFYHAWTWPGAVHDAISRSRARVFVSSGRRPEEGGSPVLHSERSMVSPVLLGRSCLVRGHLRCLYAWCGPHAWARSVRQCQHLLEA
jgi:hypothetical protein